MEVKAGMKFIDCYNKRAEITDVAHGKVSYKQTEHPFEEGWVGIKPFEVGMFKIIEETPWYPDNSGEWVEVPDDLMEMPKELHLEDEIEVLRLDEREYKEYTHYVDNASNWDWDFNSDKYARIVAYKIVKKYQEHSEESPSNQSTEWTNKHYNFSHNLTDNDIQSGSIKIDPYFVAKVWGLGKKDETGVLFHNLKTIARFGDKNSVEREIKALYGQIVRLAELNNVKL